MAWLDLISVKSMYEILLYVYLQEIVSRILKVF